MLKVDLSDLLVIIGLVLLIAGCYMVSLSLALIVAGVLFIAYAVILERSQAQQASKAQAANQTAGA